jgi:hypothetical protein
MGIEELPFFPETLTWTPRVDQGATTSIANTVAAARYWPYGALVFFELELSMTGAGTAGSGIDISTPVASAGTYCLATGDYNDASTSNHYPISAYLWTTLSPNNFTLIRIDALRNGGSAFGADPNLAIASGDTISLTGMFRRTI